MYAMFPEGLFTLAIFQCDFLLVMDVNEQMSYKCSDEGTYIQNIHTSSARSHPSEGENRTRNRSKNCKTCKTLLGFLQEKFRTDRLYPVLKKYFVWDSSCGDTGLIN